MNERLVELAPRNWLLSGPQGKEARKSGAGYRHRRLAVVKLGKGEFRVGVDEGLLVSSRIVSLNVSLVERAKASDEPRILAAGGAKKSAEASL
jgi:hypothetical protein